MFELFPPPRSANSSASSVDAVLFRSGMSRVAGAVHVVTTDGPAGRAYGSVSGPAGAPDALAVGAADGRAGLPTVRVLVRAGLAVLADGVVPLGGAVVPTRPLTLRPTRPCSRSEFRGSSSGRFLSSSRSMFGECLEVLPLRE